MSPHRARPTSEIEAALSRGGRGTSGEPRHILARGYEGGIELSGGQWQRVALAVRRAP